MLTDKRIHECIAIVRKLIFVTIYIDNGVDALRGLATSIQELNEDVRQKLPTGSFAHF
jgi:hypothetical protein